MTFAMRVLDVTPQDIVVRSTGRDVPLLRSLGEMNEAAPPDALPDPVDLFVRAVNQQMFPPGEEISCGSSARLQARSIEVTERSATWVVRIDRVHPGCLRVLSNLLSARDFDSVDVRGTASATAPGASPFDVARAPYPPARQKLPFVIEYEEGNRVSRDRLLQVEFQAPPSDDVVDGLLDVITLWCDLLLLGGYPPEDMAPREAGVIAEGPLLIDEYTVQVSFPELFHAHDRAFDAVVNHAYCLTRLGMAIAKVHIR